MDNLKIYAVVVAYNGMQWYDKCFGSLQASSVPLHVIVVDNASTDDSVLYIKEKYPTIQLIESDKNLGFAKANNIGIRYAIDHNANYVFLLNQDAWLTEVDTISLMLQSFNNRDKVGIVSPIHLNGAKSALDGSFAEYMSSDFISDAYLCQLKNEYPLLFVNAAAWLMSVECIKNIGGFDTSLFVHYGEDSNFCQRMKYHDFKIILNTSAAICHDREFRKGKEDDYRKQIFKQNDLRKRLEFGNILLDIDIDAFIKSCQKSIKKLYVKFAFSKIQKYKEDLSFYELVKKSRELNKKGGQNWL